MMRRLFIALSGCVFTACATSATFDDTPPADGGTTPDTTSCTTMCNNVCVDTKTDNNNCGKCGIACPMGATCVQGACQCMAGQTKCGNACVDTKTDGTNCGKCGVICGNDAGAPMGGGMWQCQAGACTVACPMGKTNCSDACVDTQTDIDNCGMCSNACDPQTQQCTKGMCCKTNELVCNGMCTDVKSDAMNCGMCGMACPNNNPVCSNGMCTNIPNGCKVVAGVTWCLDTVQARSCNTFCTAIGLGNPQISDNAWLAAQNTQQLCTAIGQAFNVPFGSINSYTYACAEVLNGSIECSNYSSCPTNHRTMSDGAPHYALCPCK